MNSKTYAAETELYVEGIVSIFERSLGAAHPKVIISGLSNYAAGLRKMNRAEQAEALEARAALIAKYRPFQDSAEMKVLAGLSWMRATQDAV